MFGLKRQMVEWGYSKSEVRVDTEKLFLTVDCDVIVKVTVRDKALVVDWPQAWSAWPDLVQRSEMAALTSRASEAPNVAVHRARARRATRKAEINARMHAYRTAFMNKKGFPCACSAKMHA